MDEQTTAAEWQTMEDLCYMVYCDPKDYDLRAIRKELEQIRHAYPTRVQQLIQPAFERVVENSGMDTSTRAIELFLAYGASITWPLLFHKATQELGPYNHPPALPQVCAVLHCLIRAGADPHAAWPEFGGRSSIEELGDGMSNPACLRAVESVLAEVELDRQLENTAPATGPARRQGRL